MTNEYQIIEVQQISHKVIKQILKKWMASYKTELPPSFGFKIKSFPDKIKTIEPFTILSPELFCFLVNYLKYPEDLNHNAEIIGFLKSNDPFLEGIPEQELMIYNSKTNSEYDNVNIVTKNNSYYKFDFSGDVSSISEKSRSSVFRTTKVKGFTSIKTVKIDQPKKNKVGKVNNAGKIKRFYKRTIIIIPILILCSIAAWLFDFDLNLENSSIFILGIGMFFWVAMEHDSLKYIEVFFTLLILSIVIIVVSLYLKNQTEAKVSDSVLLLPVSFLLIQILLRNIFVFLTNKEPEFDRSSNDYRNIIYTFLLLSGTITFNFLILMNFVIS